MLHSCNAGQHCSVRFHISCFISSHREANGISLYLVPLIMRGYCPWVCCGQSACDTSLLSWCSVISCVLISSLCLVIFCSPVTAAFLLPLNTCHFSTPGSCTLEGDAIPVDSSMHALPSTPPGGLSTLPLHNRSPFFPCQDWNASQAPCQLCKPGYPDIHSQPRPLLASLLGSVIRSLGNTSL